MSCEVIFKQRFVSKNNSKSAGLNARHMNYIATRPGTVYNRDCGFGLWGKLPDDLQWHIQTDLNKATKTVYSESKNHTIYRAVLSVGEETALKKNLYERQEWERLLETKISVIAKEMNIRWCNFCWCASFHREKGHPHVHIMYWDKSTDIHAEVVPKEYWEKKAERVRAEFAGEINREEILEARNSQREDEQEIRTMLRAMFPEANPAKEGNLSALLRRESLDTLSGMLAGLVKDIPAKGSLRYGYLPAGYKEKVDAFVTECLKTPEIAALLRKYEAAAREISRLYANGDESAGKQWEAAREKLYRSLGNEVMGAVKTVSEQVRLDALQAPGDADRLLSAAVRELAPGSDAYRKLLAMLPRERIPVGRMAAQIDGFAEQRRAAAQEILADARVRLRLEGYAMAAAGIPADAGENAERSEDGRYVHGRAVTDGQYEAYRAAWREAERDLEDKITAFVRDDAGWTTEALRTETAMLLCGMMRTVSQLAGQTAAGVSQARSSAKLRSKDKSRDARKDARKTRGNDYDYEP